MPSKPDCTDCPTCQARATIYRQLIETGSIDIVAASVALAELWGPGPSHAIRNTAVAGITIGLERIEKMPRAEVLEDAEGLGLCATARAVLGRRIGQRRVRAQYAMPEAKQ